MPPKQSTSKPPAKVPAKRASTGSSSRAPAPGPAPAPANKKRATATVISDDDDDIPPQPQVSDEEDEEEEEEQDKPQTIPPALLTRLLHEFFSRDGTRITRDANEAVARYMDVFVREAIARSCAERGGSGFLEVEDLEKVAPQLLLDM